MLKLLSKIPLSVLYLFSGTVYFLLYYVARYRRKVVATHLSYAFPDKDEQQQIAIAKSFYRNLADVIVESIHSASMTKQEIQQRVKVINPEVLQAIIDTGSSFNLLGGHCANWEWLLLSASIEVPISMDAVYKPLHAKSADRFMYEMRTRFGADLINLKDVMTEVIKRKGSQRFYSILSDQRPPTKGRAHVTQFLNRETRFFIGPEKIAQFTKIPVVFVKMTRVSRGQYEVSFELLAEPPYKKTRDTYPVTELYVRALEKQIIESPDSWLWSNRRWK
ncbi:MAG: lysophospholipid acyltransferase family protein [Pseudomonadales bacterium]